MSSNSMITHTLRLDHIVGGIEPQLQLKEGCSAAEVRLILTTEDTTPFPQGMSCVIRGIRPDGDELFLCSSSARDDGKVLVNIPRTDTKKMAEVPGEYRCTLTFLGTNSNVNRENYMNHDFLTVLPFTVIVHKKA